MESPWVCTVRIRTTKWTDRGRRAGPPGATGTFFHDLVRTAARPTRWKLDNPQSKLLRRRHFALVIPAVCMICRDCGSYLPTLSQTSDQWYL